MFCSKCGMQNINGDKFCKSCGCLLDSPQQIDNLQPLQQNQYINNQAMGQPSPQNTDYTNNAINPNMKKWAILSIVVPIVGIIWYIFIGLSFYIAVLIASVGLSFAKKGEMADQKLAKIGTILNYILMIMAVIMLILIILKVV